MASSGMAIIAEDLTKRYGGTTMLDGVSLEVRPGTVLGLLGPNGAGKTTAVRILTTLLRADSGRAVVAGFDVIRQAAQVRASIGLVGQHAAVDEILSGRSNLVMFGPLHGLLTTQYLEEADQLADHVAVIAAGRVVADESPDDLKTRLGGDRIEVVLRSAADLPAATELIKTVTGAAPQVDDDTRRIGAPVRDRIQALTQTVRCLDDAGIVVEDVTLRRPTVDEVFLHLTGRVPAASTIK